MICLMNRRLKLMENRMKNEKKEEDIENHCRAK